MLIMKARIVGSQLNNGWYRSEATGDRLIPHRIRRAAQTTRLVVATPNQWRAAVACNSNNKNGSQPSSPR
jgi:hypothetical protein